MISIFYTWYSLQIRQVLPKMAQLVFIFHITNTSKILMVLFKSNIRHYSITIYEPVLLTII